MDRKLIFFDIDGTLTTPKNKIPESTKEAITLLKDAGHIPVLSTGRSPGMLADVSHSLGIDSYISLNGQYVIANKEELFKNVISTKDVNQIIEKTYDLGGRAFVLTKDQIIGNNLMHEMMDFEFMTYIYSLMSDLKLIDVHTMFNRMTEMPLRTERYTHVEVLGLFIHALEENDQIYKDTLKGFHVTRSTPMLLEVLQDGTNKATGIKQVMQYFGIDQANTYAFGDSLNDLEMIQYVGTGVAMENGRDELKAVADHIAPSVEKDGIYKSLERLSLI